MGFFGAKKANYWVSDIISSFSFPNTLSHGFLYGYSGCWNVPVCICNIIKTKKHRKKRAKKKKEGKTKVVKIMKYMI